MTCVTPHSMCKQRKPGFIACYAIFFGKSAAFFRWRLRVGCNSARVFTAGAQEIAVFGGLLDWYSEKCYPAYIDEIEAGPRRAGRPARALQEDHAIKNGAGLGYFRPCF